MVKHHDHNQLMGERVSWCLWFQRDGIHHSREGWQQSGKAWWSEQEASWSHFIHTQEAEGEQEVEPGCKISKLTPEWYTSSSKTALPKGSITLLTVPPTRSRVFRHYIQTSTALKGLAKAHLLCCMVHFEAGYHNVSFLLSLGSIGLIRDQLLLESRDEDI